MSERNDDGLARLVSQAHGRASDAIDTTASEATEPYVLLNTGARWYGVAASSVREVIAGNDVSAVPAAPQHVLGLTLIHSRLVPVVAIQRLVNSADTALHGERMVVLHEENREIAVLSETVRGLIEMPAALPDADTQADRATWVSKQIAFDGKQIAIINVPELIETATSMFKRVAARTVD